MSYWTRYRYHGNTAGSKPALNSGFDLFSENPVVRFFPSFVSRKLKKILAYWYWSRTILTKRSPVIFCFAFNVLCQISIFVCRRAKRVLNYYSTKFHEILRSGSVEIWVHCHLIVQSQFLVNCACAAFDRIRSFSIHTNNPRKAGCFPIVLPFIHWKQTFLTHNKLFDC